MMQSLPGLAVCMTAYRSEATIRRSVESIDQVLRGLKWALILCVDGHDDDSGGIVKRMTLSARHVYIEQFDKAPSLSEACNRPTRIAYQIRRDYPYFTFADADDEMLPGKVDVFRAASTFGHDVLLGGAVASSGDRRWRHEAHFNHFTDQNAAHLAVFRSAILDPDCPLFDPEAHDDILNDVVMWARLRTFKGIEPGVLPAKYVTNYQMQPTSWSNRNASQMEKWNLTQRWISQRGIGRRQPDCVAIVAGGQSARSEARLSIQSARLSGISSRFLVATDSPMEFEGLPDVDTTPIDPILQPARAAIEHYGAMEWSKGIFLYAAAKTQLAMLALRDGAVMVADSDMFYIREFPVLPKRPASCVEVRGDLYADYTHHGWGLHSTGLIWIPADQGEFVAELERVTLSNLREYRWHSTQQSTPGNGRFAEQGGFDTLCNRMPTDSLPPGNNLAPAMFKPLQNYFPMFSGQSLCDELEKHLGLQEGDGWWWNGWCVRSLHTHFGRKVWCPVFNEAIKQMLEAQPRLRDHADLLGTFLSSATTGPRCHRQTPW